MKNKWGSKKVEKVISKVVDQKSTKKTLLTSDAMLAVNRDTDKVKAVDSNPTV